MGEVVMRGNNVMSGYFADAAATEKAFRGGWFHSGDLAVMAPGRQHRAARPQQGHHHLRRREHLEHRGRADDLRPSGRARVRGRRDSARALGGATEGLRHAQPRRERERRRRSSRSAASGSPTTSALTRSSSGRCRRPRPARSRNSLCGSANGPGTRRASGRHSAAVGAQTRSGSSPQRHRVRRGRGVTRAVTLRRPRGACPSRPHRRSPAPTPFAG